MTRTVLPLTCLGDLLACEPATDIAGATGEVGRARCWSAGVVVVVILAGCCVRLCCCIIGGTRVVAGN